ncbi:TorF family putative porin [Pseudoduganella plicata]|uniref:Exported protein n=1 Tax=Pseudoduganella plicata TaxID=321984 RepID=A0A4P7BHE7_9BURK|nr:TorF family putative porin [Pseudoduganella plicata]QBQ36899.1 hypothetical protein E1742_12535 [Pseudoduganella plicata]GGZ07450.1 exported protein [Pseudoduganella plicata]
MKRLFSGIPFAFAFASVFAAGAKAQESTPTPASTLTYNVAVTSDYRFRGISQTRLKPALQGGADWVDAGTGFYAGAWLSTIRWTRDAGGDGGSEWDLYAGKRGTLGNLGGSAISYDAGLLGYVYPSNRLHPDANTLELYGQLGAGPWTLKYSHAATNLFGFTDSRHSGYLDLSFNREIGGVVVTLHAGRQKVKQHDAADYTDWKVGVTKDFGVASVALAWIATNAGASAYASPVNGKFTGKDALVLTVSKVF